MANINDFKAKLAGGGARANQFKVTMPFPGYAQVGGEIEDLAFLCRSTTIPAMSVPSFNVPFRGRSIKIAGDRTIGDWSVTVYNDTNFKLRNAFERWQNGINNMTDNEGLTNPSLSDILLIPFCHLSKASLNLKFVSFNTVIDQGSNVLSAARYTGLPRKFTVVVPIAIAGIEVA